MAGQIIKPGAPRTSYYKPEEDANWEHFGCEICGNVEKLPWHHTHTNEEPKNMPWCWHGNGYIWAYGDPEQVKKLEKTGATMMKRVEVRVRDL